MPADPPAMSRSMATRPPASSTPPAPPALPRARSSRTTTSPPTPSTCSPAGRSPPPTASCWRCRCSTSTRLGNGLHCWLARGCRMRLLERFEHQTAAATFLDFRPTLFFGVPTIYVRLLEIAGRQARADRRRHAPLRFRLGAARPRRCWRSSARASATPSWSATA